MNFSWLIRSESYRRGTVLSVFFNILSKGILFLLTIIIARYFGSDIKTDIYFFVFGAMLLFSGFINNIDVAVLIPESMRLREREGNDSATAFLNFFLVIYFIIGVLFTAVMYFFGTTVFGLISKFPEQDILVYRNYFWTGSLFFIFHLLTNYINTILTSLKYFSIPMLISSIKSIIAIICIFLLKANYDVLSVFIGGLISYAFNLLFLLLILKKTIGWNFKIEAVKIKKRAWLNIFYAELGQVATLASSLFPLYLLSGFGSGVLSVMNYGKNIADIPNTLVTTQFANVSGIKLNEEIARNDHAAMNDTFVRTSKLLVFILVPMGFFLFAFAAPVVELFYQSRNFSADATAESAVFLRLLAISIFSIGINAMVARVFIAAQAIKQAFFYQVTLNILLIAAIWICTKKYGAYGYPYGIIIVNVVNYFGMYFICRKLASVIDYAAVLKYTGIIILINAGIATGLYFAVHFLHAANLSSLAFGFLAYLIILLILNKKFKLNIEPDHILKHVKRFFFKRWYIKICRYLLGQKYIRIMAGPLKGYLWSTAASYEYILGTYEDPEVMAAFISWLKPGSVLYDLGGNIGYYALTANRFITTGKIYSFEPLPSARVIFEEHINLNKKFITNDNIRIVPVAISDREKKVEFSDSSIQKEGNTYIRHSAVFTTAENRITVQCYSVDELVNQGYDKPGIIKIDVEGAEYDVLQGAINTLQQLKPHILLATHDCQLAGVKDDCIRFLESQGYSLKHAGRYNKQLEGLDDYIAIHKTRL